MTIADCGFPPVTIVPGSNPPRYLLGRDLLLDKGPTIQVEIGFDNRLHNPDPAVVQAAMQAVSEAPAPPILLDALIDTGARDSCIDEDIAKSLGLPLIDRAPCSGVGGAHQLNVFLGYIRIVPLGVVQCGRFIGAKLSEGNQPHKALLGRTLFQGMVLVYDGRDGSVRLAT